MRAPTRCLALATLSLLFFGGCQTRPAPVSAWEIDITIEGAPTLLVAGRNVVYRDKTYTPDDWETLSAILIAELQQAKPQRAVALKIPRGEEFWSFYSWIPRLRTLPVKRVFLTGPE